MKKFFLILVFTFMIAATAFSGSINKVDVGSITRGDDTVVSMQVNPGSDIYIRLSGQLMVMNQNDQYELMNLLNLFLRINEEVLDSDIKVKYRRHIGRVSTKNKNLWAKVTCNYENGIARVYLSGSVITAHTYESDEWTLLPEEAQQILDMIVDARGKSNKMITDIEKLNEIIYGE